MLQKIIGILGVLVVAGVITMVVLSPRAKGFYPDLFDFSGQRAVTKKTEMTKKIIVPAEDEVKTIENR